RLFCPACGLGFEALDPRLFSFNSRQGACPACVGAGVTVDLDPEAILDPARSLEAGALVPFEVAELRPAKRRLLRALAAAGGPLKAILPRLGFLAQVGLAYLTLDRRADTLSGGEGQRIRLAAQLGSNLRGVCYILDEPTIGLHPRDNAMLLDTLELLRARGNTVLVVEHDEATIRRADLVVGL